MTNLAIPEPPGDFRYRFRVPFHQVDRAGILFFAHVFTHAHDAYEAFMHTCGRDLGGIVANGERIPLAHAEADYHAPLRHGDAVQVALTLLRRGNRSVTLEYAFINAEGQTCATVRTVHVDLHERAGPSTSSGRTEVECRSW